MKWVSRRKQNGVVMTTVAFFLKFFTSLQKIFLSKFFRDKIRLDCKLIVIQPHLPVLLDIAKGKKGEFSIFS